MRRLISSVGVLAIVLFFAGCGSGSDAIQLNQQTAQAKVTEFLQIMVTDQRPKTLMDFIAPSYLKAAKIDAAAFTVNSYYPKTFKIEQSYPSTDLSNAINVVAVIAGEGNGWAHRLTFVVFNDNGKLVLFPGKHDNDTKFVDPWYSIQEYVQ